MTSPTDATVKRHGRCRLRVRPSLGLLLLCLLLFARADAPSQAGHAATLAEGLSNDDVARAEKVLKRLSKMRVALAEAGKAHGQRRLYQRYYPNLFIIVAQLRESELKTELDTAVFMYERLVRPDGIPDVPAECEHERPDTYGPLCESLPGATVRQVLWVKAELHTRWAEALVKSFRGAADAETRATLNRLAAVRRSDVEIAGLVLENCERAGLILSSHPLFNEGRRGGRDSGSRVRGEAASALLEARRRASSLPRSPLWYRLSNAVSAYEDGLFWLGRLEQAKSPVVSAQGPAGITLIELGIPADVVGVSVNGTFKHAHAYMNASAQMLSELRRRFKTVDFKEFGDDDLQSNLPPLWGGDADGGASGIPR